MVCKICKNEIINKIKIKNGYICQECYEKLPESAKANITSFNIKQVKQMHDIISDAKETPWANCGAFKVGKTTIQINNKEIKLKDLRSVRLNFHPNALGLSVGTTVGTLTVIIETKSPHYMFEEPFYAKEVTASYRINGKNISYGYSYAIESLFKLIQKCIDDKKYDMSSYIKEYQKTTQQSTSESTQNTQQKTNTTNNKAYNSNGSTNNKTNTNNSNNTNNTNNRANSNSNTNQNKSTTNNTSKPKSPFEEAKALFNVELPYTATDIKKVRNTLVKKYHPDLGGSEEMCKRINEAYTLLLKFAS